MFVTSDFNVVSATWRWKYEQDDIEVSWCTAPLDHMLSNELQCYYELLLALILKLDQTRYQLLFSESDTWTCVSIKWKVAESGGAKPCQATLLEWELHKATLLDGKQINQEGAVRNTELNAAGRKPDRITGIQIARLNAEVINKMTSRLCLYLNYMETSYT